MTMQHIYYTPPRQDVVADYERARAVAAVTANYRDRLIGREIAVAQLRSADCFEAEIRELLQ